MLIFDVQQLAATGIALATLPILIGAHALARRWSWGLPFGAVVQTLCWWTICRFLLALDAPFRPTDWVAGGAILGSLWLAWMWIYSTLCRGFSLQLMVELQERPRSRDDLASGYAGGKGLDWMLDKRIHGLETAGLAQRQIVEGKEELRMTSLGGLLARLARCYKWLVGIGAGG